MLVHLKLKTIEPAQSEEKLAVSYLASCAELGEFELKILTPIQSDLNAAEQAARAAITAFAEGLLDASRKNPLTERQLRQHP